MPIIFLLATQVVYINKGSDSINGLVSGQIYYVVYVDANTIKLATDPGGTNIVNLGVTAASTIAHAFRKVGNLSVDGDDITLSSDSKLIVGDIALSGSGGSTFAIGGSVSVNAIVTDTQSYFNNASATALSDLLIEAEDGTILVSVAGAIQVAVNSKSSDDEEGRSDANAVGASVGVNVIDSGVRAYVSGSSITHGGSATLTALSGAEIWAFSVAGSIGVATTSKEDSGSGTFAASGAFSINIIKSVVESYIAQGSTLTATSSGAVTLSAEDNTKIVANAIAVSIGVAVGKDDSGGGAVGDGACRKCN